MKTRKIIATILVIGSLAVAGTAFAAGRGAGNNNRQFVPCPCERQNFNAEKPGFPGRNGGAENFAPEGRNAPMPPKPDMRGARPQPPMPFTRNFFGVFCRPFKCPQPFEGNFARGFDKAPRQPQRPSRFTPDMPDEIRNKTADVAKLRIDLDNVMSKRPLDREKATEIYKKIAGIESEINVWRFNKKLDGIEKFEQLKKERQEKMQQDKAPVKAPEKPEAPAKPEKPENN